MYNHAPHDYICPFCQIAQDARHPDLDSLPGDIVLHTASVTAFVGSRQWPNNPGNVLIIPNEHFENLYDLPAAYATAIHEVARAVALAMKAVFRCDGVSTRQHNEPAGSQEVWHYHLHVTPRYTGDDFYAGYTVEYHFMPPAERAQYAEKLRQHLARAGNA